MLQKLREAALAYQIERQWSKDKILTNYLNNIYFGNGAYGVEAAAKTYFGWNHPGCGDPDDRCAEVVEPQEAAMLAGADLLADRLRPGDEPQRREGAAQRRAREDARPGRARGAATRTSRPCRLTGPDGARSAADRGVGGPVLHRLAAPAGRRQVRRADRRSAAGCRSSRRSTSTSRTPPSRLVSDRLSGLGPTAAVVVIDNGSGEVLAMVGGQDFASSPFNLATNGQRQPGSSFKPFTLVTALKEGHSPDEVFESAPQSLPFEAKVIGKNGKRRP